MPEIRASTLNGQLTGTIWSIQYLRGFAALAVVLFHVSGEGRLVCGIPQFQLGAQGVDLFFIISGFIMFTAARNETPIRFISTRIIRIYPLYWIMLTTITALYYYNGNWGFSGRELAASFALWPRYSFGHPDKIWPILIPGWTLTYELLFYLLFLLGIIVKKPVLFPLIVIATLIVLGESGKPHAAPLYVATSPQMAEFIVGLLIGVCASKKPSMRWTPVALTLAALIAGLTFHWHTLIVQSSVAAIVAIAVLFEPAIRLHKSSIMKSLGDASYSMYLVHTPVIYLLSLLYARTIGEISPIRSILNVIVVSCLSILAGILMYRTVEKPMLMLMRRRLDAALGSAEVPSSERRAIRVS